MRRPGAALAAALVAVGLALAGGGGCTLFDSEPPDRSCRTDNDCFRAQGERCDQAARTCVLIDAGAFAPSLDEPTAPGDVPTAGAAEVTP